MNEMTVASIERRFLWLRASRWLPTGLMIPIFVLYLVDQGLTLTQIGLVFAAQGLVIFLLELPTGGLADAIGRRRVLLAANIFNLATLAMLLVGGSVLWFAVAFAMEGVYRALESGPLESWYVDATLEIAPDTNLERGLSRGTVVLGLAIAAGSLLSGGIVAIGPFGDLPVLAAPLVIALILRVVDTSMIAWLMTEAPRRPGSDTVSFREVPVIIKSALHLAVTSIPLLMLVLVEVSWGLGVHTWESLFPVRLEEIVGGSDRAGALMGPLAAAAWIVSAAGAGLAPRASRRYGRHTAASWIRVLQALTVLGMALVGGTVGLMTAYLACYTLHGATNPIHSTLMHAEAESANRTTVASLNSMAGMGAAALGGILLGAIADSASVSTAMIVGAVFTAAAAPLYLIAGRRTKTLARAA